MNSARLGHSFNFHKIASFIRSYTSQLTPQVAQNSMNPLLYVVVQNIVSEDGGNVWDLSSLRMANVDLGVS